MLRQPIPQAELHAGSDMSASIILLSTVGGISRVFYDPKRYYYSGRAWINCLIDYFPLNQELTAPSDPERQVLYLSRGW